MSEIRPPIILYIDDDKINRSLVKRILSDHKLQVIEAETGLKGLEIARKTPPDIILMDINMPGLDGHETTTRMRSILTLQKIPIVALTARRSKGERELALAAGCDGYIPKPIEIDLFPQQIMAYLEGHRETITNDEQRLYLGHYRDKLVRRLESKVLELQEANARLRKIDKIKADFITLAAHELRTPIALVYGYASILQEITSTEAPPSSKENVQNLTQKIYQASHRLNEVVNDILNISLIATKEMKLERSEVRLHEVVDDALKELNPNQAGRELKIGVKNLSSLPKILGDRKRLQQAFWNVLSNAIKFTPDGGSISISARQIVSDEEPDTPPAIIIEVKDTGIGLTNSDQREIFEQFYVVKDTIYHHSSKTDFGGGGMGLGLPIAKGIIEAHGGRMWVESEEEKAGSCFYVHLPLNNKNPKNE